MSYTTRLEAEIQRLQCALSFWLPNVPVCGGPVSERIVADVHLLLGYKGPVKPDAQGLGWITLHPEKPVPPTTGPQENLPL